MFSQGARDQEFVAIQGGPRGEDGDAPYLAIVPPDYEWSYLSLSGYRTKGLFDLVVGGAAAVVFLPVGLLIGFTIFITTGGPVCSYEVRIGKRGLLFQQAAFRTTVEDDGPRLTLLGRFLDHTGLCKLPQLLNVLRGEMSMVGPRALRPAETHFYGSAMPIVLSVRPGILEPRPVPKGERSYEDGTLVQSELDVAYVADRSALLDLRICLDALRQKTAGCS